MDEPKPGLLWKHTMASRIIAEACSAIGLPLLLACSQSAKTHQEVAARLVAYIHDRRSILDGWNPSLLCEMR